MLVLELLQTLAQEAIIMVFGLLPRVVMVLTMPVALMEIFK